MSLQKTWRKTNQTFLGAKRERKTLSKGFFPASTSILDRRWKPGKPAKPVLTAGADTGNAAAGSAAGSGPSCTRSCPRSSSLFPEQSVDCPRCGLPPCGQAPPAGEAHTTTPGQAPPRAFPTDLRPSPLCFQQLAFSGHPAAKPYGTNDQTGGESE